MEYILTSIGLLIAGLVAFIFNQNKKIQKLDNDIKIKEFEVVKEKQNKKLLIQKAAIKGAELGAKQKMEEFYSKYGHLIKSSEQSSPNGD